MLSPDEFAFENGIVNERTEEMAKIKLGECYEDTCGLIRKYMDMPEEYVKLCATWIMGTHFHSTFQSYPYLFINAMRGSGKTRLLKIIATLSRNSFGKVQSGITESVLFRMPSGNTLVLDEIEGIGSKEKQTLREYMNASYKKGGTVGRNKKARIDGKEEWVTEWFEPYKPIAMANIWGMDEVLGDRCISVILEKSNNISKTKLIEDFDTNEQFKRLNELLKRISVVKCRSVYNIEKKTLREKWNFFIQKKHSPTLNDISTLKNIDTYNNIITYNNIKEEEISMEEEEFFNRIDEIGVDGRNLELLLPLLFIAKEMSQEVFEDILKIGKEIMQKKKEEEMVESKDVCLYEFVSKQSSVIEYQPLKSITHAFKTWLGSDEEWLNEKWVGRALSRLQLAVSKKRMASGQQVILNVAKAKEKFKMFLTEREVEK